jgi:hypothetical protein
MRGYSEKSSTTSSGLLMLMVKPWRRLRPKRSSFCRRSPGLASLGLSYMHLSSVDGIAPCVAGVCSTQAMSAA